MGDTPAAQFGGTVNIKFLNPFIEAAFAVLEAELETRASRGQLGMVRSARAADEITVLIYLQGQVQGVVLYGLNQHTAKNIVTKILGQPFAEFNALAQSGISELGNVITGRAGQYLEEAGYRCQISIPALVMGKDTLISTLDFDRLHVPIHTDLGDLQVHLALHETEPEGVVV